MTCKENGHKRAVLLLQALSSRVRFGIQEVLDLCKSKWVPRRQKEEAKKISEIHAAAHAELGMMPTVMPGLAPLPALSRGAAPGMASDMELFPAFKGDGAPCSCQQSCPDAALLCLCGSAVLLLS